MCWAGCGRVSLFVNAFEVMAWVLGIESQPSEQEGG